MLRIHVGIQKRTHTPMLKSYHGRADTAPADLSLASASNQLGASVPVMAVIVIRITADVC